MLHSRRGGGSRHGNGVTSPGILSGDPLRSRQRRRRLPFCTLRFVHSALVSMEALTTPVRRFTRNCVLPARTLQKNRHRGRVGAGAPCVGDVPSLRVSMERGGTSRWCSDEGADCRCQRAPKSEGASSTFGVGSFCCSSLGTLRPRECCEHPPEASLCGHPLSLDSFPASALRVVTSDAERGD